MSVARPAPRCGLLLLLWLACRVSSSAEAPLLAGDARRLLRGPEPTVRVALTLPGGGGVVAEVTRFEILAPGAVLVERSAAGEAPLPRPDLVLRKGRLAGDPASVVFLAATADAVWGAIRTAPATLQVAPDADGLLHVADTASLPPRTDRKCGVDDAPIDLGQPLPTDVPRLDRSRTLARLEAEVAVDVDQNLFTFLGSTQNATSYVLSLMAQCSAFYEIDVDVQLAVTYLRVWTTADPYTGGSSSTVLQQFRSYWNANMGGVPRDIAHLVTRQGFGGIAYLDVLCNMPYGYGVSGIDAVYNYPNGSYTWDADVVSHEIGHNFGSPHTHCYSPPVDRCYNQEPGCYSGTVVPQIGTIMSYCHLVAGKVLEFSPEEQAVIRGGAQSAGCVGPPGGCTGIGIAPATLPDGTELVPYAQTLTASGGTAPYAWGSTTLPPWLALASAGPDTATLQGTPPAAGTYNFTVDVVDAVACGGTRSYTLVVGYPPCTDDGYEPNDTFATAALLPTGSLTFGLSWCDDADYFGMALGTGDGLTATITFNAARGNLDLELLDPAGTSLGTSAGTGGTESVTLPAAASAGTYVIRVFAAAGTEIDYVLTTAHAGTAPSPRTLAGPGPAAQNPNLVRAFDDQGALRTELTAYGAGTFGTNVGADDVDADGQGEIVTGPGPGAVFGPQVRAFESSTAPVAKVNFYAYGTLRFGVRVATGDLDGDAIAEMLTTPGPGAVFGPHVRAFDYDGSALAAMANVNYFAYGTLRFGANAAAGRLLSGGNDEILTGPGPSGVFAPTVRGWSVLSGQVAAIPAINFNAAATTHGANVGGADVDGDGFEEIVAGLGPAPANACRLLAYDFDGSAVTPMAGGDVTAFATGAYGAWVAGADWTADGNPEAVAGRGPDPAFGSQVRAYQRAGAAFVLVPASDLTAFPALGNGYGATVAGGSMP